MKTFLFLMQHLPTLDQVIAARAMGCERIVAMAARPEPKKEGDPEAIEGVEYLGNTKLLTVPDDPSLDQNWFVDRASEILQAVTGCEVRHSHNLQNGDVVHAMGQQQLVNAINALARHEAELVESVTERKTVESIGADQKVTKTAVFEFKGYRKVYRF